MTTPTNPVAAVAVTTETLDAHGQPLATSVTLYKLTGEHHGISPETLRLIKTGALPLAEIFNPTPAPPASTRTPLIYEEQ